MAFQIPDLPTVDWPPPEPPSPEPPPPEAFAGEPEPVRPPEEPTNNEYWTPAVPWWEAPQGPELTPPEAFIGPPGEPIPQFEAPQGPEPQGPEPAAPEPAAPEPFVPPPQFEDIGQYLETQRQAIEERFPKPEAAPEGVSVPSEVIEFEKTLKQEFGYVPGAEEGANIFSDVQGMQDFFSQLEHEVSPEKFQEELDQAIQRSGRQPTDQEIEQLRQQWTSARLERLGPLLSVKDIVLPYVEAIAAQRETAQRIEERQAAEDFLDRVASLGADALAGQTVELPDFTQPADGEFVRVGTFTFKPRAVAEAFVAGDPTMPWDTVVKDAALRQQSIQETVDAIHNIPVVGPTIRGVEDVVNLLAGVVGGAVGKVFEAMNWVDETAVRTMGYLQASEFPQSNTFDLSLYALSDNKQERVRQIVRELDDQDRWRAAKWFPTYNSDPETARAVVDAIKAGRSDDEIDSEIANPLLQTIYQTIFSPWWFVPGPGWASKIKFGRQAALLAEVADVAEVPKIGQPLRREGIFQRLIGMAQTAPSRAVQDIQDIHSWVDRWLDLRVLADNEVAAAVRALAKPADQAAREFFHANPMTVLGVRAHELFSTVPQDALEAVIKQVAEKPVWPGSAEAFALLPKKEQARYFADLYAKKSELVQQLLPLAKRQVLARYGLDEAKGLTGLGLAVDNAILALKGPQSLYFLATSLGYYVRNYMNNVFRSLLDNGFSLRYFARNNPAELDKIYRAAGITSRPGAFSPADIVDLSRELRGERDMKRSLGLMQEATSLFHALGNSIEGNSRAAIIVKAFDEYTTGAMRFASKGGKLLDMPKDLADGLGSTAARLRSLIELGDRETLGRLRKTFAEAAGRLPATAQEFLPIDNYPGMTRARLQVVSRLVRKAQNGQQAAEAVRGHLDDMLATINADRAAMGLHQLDRSSTRVRASLETWKRQLNALADELGGDYQQAERLVVRYLAERDQYRANLVESLREVLHKVDMPQAEIDRLMERFSHFENFDAEIIAPLRGIEKYRPLVRFMDGANKVIDQMFRHPTKGLFAIVPRFDRNTGQYVKQAGNLTWRELYGTVDRPGAYSDLLAETYAKIGDLFTDMDIDYWARAVVRSQTSARVEDFIASWLAKAQQLPENLGKLGEALRSARAAMSLEQRKVWAQSVAAPEFAEVRQALRAISTITLQPKLNERGKLVLYQVSKAGDPASMLSMWTDNAELAAKMGLLGQREVNPQSVLANWAVPDGRGSLFLLTAEKTPIRDVASARTTLRRILSDLVTSAGPISDNLGMWTPRTMLFGRGRTVVGEDLLRFIVGQSGGAIGRLSGILGRGLTRLEHPQIESAGMLANFGAARYLDDLARVLEQAGDFKRYEEIAGKITRTTARRTVEYLDQVIKQLGDIELAAKLTAEAMADWSLHNYGSRFGYQRIAQFVFPWELWTTRTYAKSLITLVDRPYLAHLYDKYQGDRDKWGFILSAFIDPEEFADLEYAKERYQESQRNVPDWLKNEFKLVIPKSWAFWPDSLRRQIAIDPLKAMVGVVGDPFVDRDLENLFGRQIAELIGAYASPAPAIMATAKAMGVFGPGARRDWFPIWPMGRLIQSATAFTPMRQALTALGIDVPAGGFTVGPGSRTRDYRYRQLVDALYRRGGFTLQDAADALAGKDNALARQANDLANTEMALRGLGSALLGFPIATQAEADVARREAMEETLRITSELPRAEWGEAFRQLESKYGRGIPSRIRKAADAGDWDGLQREVTRLRVGEELAALRDEYGTKRADPANFMALQRLRDEEREAEEKILAKYGLDRQSFFEMNMSERYRDYADDLERRAEAVQHPERYSPARLAEIMSQPIEDQYAFLLAWAKQQYYDIPNFFKDPETGWIDWKSAIWAQQQYIASQPYVDPIILDIELKQAPRTIGDAVKEAYDALGFERWLAASKEEKRRLEATTPSRDAVVAYVSLYRDEKGNQKWAKEDIERWLDTMTLPSIGAYVDQWDKSRIEGARNGKPFMTSHGLVTQDNVEDYVAALEELNRYQEQRAVYRAARDAWWQQRNTAVTSAAWWDRYAVKQATGPFPSNLRPVWSDRLERWFGQGTKREPVDVWERIEVGLPDWVPNPYQAKIAAAGPQPQPSPLQSQPQPQPASPRPSVPQPSYPQAYSPTLAKEPAAEAPAAAKPTAAKANEPGEKPQAVKFNKWNDTPQEALKTKYIELVVLPGNEAWQLVKDSKDRKLKARVTKATIDPAMLVAAVLGDPVYQARGFTPEMLWPIVEADGVPTLGQWWRSDEPPEARAIGEEIDKLWDEVNELLDQRDRERGRRPAEPSPIDERIALIRALEARRKRIIEGREVTIFEGTPELLRDVLEGKVFPAPERPTRRGGGGGGGGGGRESFVPDGSESPQIEALKRELQRIPARFRYIWIAMIRALRAGQPLPPRVFSS